MLNIKEEFNSAIDQVNNIAELDLLRLNYLGKKGIISVQLAQLGKIELALRKEQGAKINLLKNYVIEQIEQKRSYFVKQQIKQQLAQEELDVTLPRRANNFGSIHPISFVTKEIVDIFANMGFSVVNGPEIEDDYHNFTALNIAKNHPARQMHDTFYLEQKNKLLRTHTSSVQVRTLNKGKPPFAIIAPGKTIVVILIIPYANVSSN